MTNYTELQKQEALEFFEDGCTAQEIFEVTKIPTGTLYRWRHEAKQPGASGTELAQFRGEGEDLRRLEDFSQALKFEVECLSSKYEKLARGFEEMSQKYAQIEQLLRSSSVPSNTEGSSKGDGSSKPQAKSMASMLRGHTTRP